MRERTTRSFIQLRLMRGIMATAVHYDFHIDIVSHIPGTHNVFADAASRLSTQTPLRLQELGLLLIHQVQPIIPPWLQSLMMQTNSSKQD